MKNLKALTFFAVAMLFQMPVIATEVNLASFNVRQGSMGLTVSSPSITAEERDYRDYLPQAQSHKRIIGEIPDFTAVHGISVGQYHAGLSDKKNDGKSNLKGEINQALRDIRSMVVVPLSFYDSRIVGKINLQRKSVDLRFDDHWKFEMRNIGKDNQSAAVKFEYQF